MVSFDKQSQIEIFQIKNPHKFWYKKCHDLEEKRLEELEESIKNYAVELIEWQEQKPINRYDVVVALHPKWNKWVRGKAGKLKSSSKTNIQIWLLDYGCELMLPLENVYVLDDPGTIHFHFIFGTNAIALFPRAF